MDVHARRTVRALSRLSARFVLAAVIAGCAGLAQADLVTNGSFTSGLATWNQPGAPAVGYALVTSTRDGSQAVQVTARRQVDDAPRQNVLAGLLALGSGTRFTSRFWVESAEPQLLRCHLSLVDGNGFRKVIISEVVVRQPNTWTFGEGTQVITWSGTLTTALVSFEAEKVGENIFADITLDDISVELDADGDRLTDPEEAFLGTDRLVADGDGDGLPDGWEVRSLLDPTTPDETLDPDGDCFTNRQEYWAATDPQDAASTPGIPSNPNASAAARAVLLDLALRPSRDTDRVLVGQHLEEPGPTLNQYAAYVTALESLTGRELPLLALQYDDVANPPPIAAVNPFAIAQWNRGGLVQIKWNPLNPWTNAFYGDRTFFGFDEILTPGTAANLNFTAQLQVVADGLQELRDAGVVVLWRYGSEMNGGWFWWGQRDRQGYVDYWRFIHDKLTRERGLDNLLFVYESDAGVHQGCSIDYYWPGNDVVDVVGHNFYDDDWVHVVDTDWLYRRYPKVAAIPQAGPQAIRDGTWSNLNYLDGVPAGAGGLRHAVPRVSFFIPWNSFPRWDPVTMQSTNLHIALVDNPDAGLLFDDPWIATLESARNGCDLPARDSDLHLLKDSAAGLVRFTWVDALPACDHVVVEDAAPDGAFTAQAGAAPTGTIGLTLPLASGTSFYLAAARNPCGLGPLD